MITNQSCTPKKHPKVREVFLVMLLSKLKQLAVYLSITPLSKYMANRPQKVGQYRTYVNQYKVTVPSTFTLVYKIVVSLTSSPFHQAIRFISKPSLNFSTTNHG